MSTQIQLVAIDLDGTLLNSAKQITETTAAILKAAHRMHGVRVVLATARPPRSVMPFYSLLELDTPMINYNGALVFDPPAQSVLLHRPIPLETSRRLVTQAREAFPGVHVSAEVLDRWYTDHLDKAYMTATARTFDPDEIAPIDDWLTGPITKLLLLGDPPPLSKLAHLLAREFQHQIIIMQTEPYMLQIAHATVSKVQALRVVASELGARQEEIMAIGDNANDVDMLRWAGVGVAMANAAPEVLRAADAVTDHHDADGAAHAVRRMIQSGSPADPHK